MLELVFEERLVVRAQVAVAEKFVAAVGANDRVDHFFVWDAQDEKPRWFENPGNFVQHFVVFRHVLEKFRNENGVEGSVFVRKSAAIALRR